MSVRAAKRMKFLLPIKTSQGRLVMQSREEEPEDQLDDKNEEASTNELDEGSAASDDGGVAAASDSDIEPDCTAQSQLTPVEQMALEETKAAELKITIANYAQSVMDNPQENVGHLRKLRLLLADPLCQSRPLLADYIAVSLCEVFKDILPSYKIRLATETEKSQLAKKETKRLRAFEETLLINYQKYLAVLREAMRKQDSQRVSSVRGKPGKDLKLSGWRRKRKRAAEQEEGRVAYSNRLVAIRCLSQLLANHSNFNQSSELIAWLTPCLNSRSEAISSIVCSAFRQLFVEDRAGEATLRAVKSICRVAVASGAKVHADLLEVLANVRLDLPPPEKDSKKDGAKRLNHREKLARLSRRERRQDKRSAETTRGLEELRHQESVAVRSRLQQRCAELLLHLYLRVLRAKPGARALTAALTGLGRLALRVNLDLLPDLFAALGALLDGPDLSAAHSIEVVSTALALLSGEGESLTLDPRNFYVHLYKRLNRLVRQHPELAQRLAQTLLACLANRRRYLPPMRPVNFLRRLMDSICELASVSGSSCANAQTESALICLLNCAARLFAVFPRAHRLLEPGDFDAEYGDAGTPVGALAIVLDNHDPDLTGLTSGYTCEPALKKLSGPVSPLASGLIKRLLGLLLKLDFSAVIAASGGGGGDSKVAASNRHHRSSVDDYVEDEGDNDNGDADPGEAAESRNAGAAGFNRGRKPFLRKHSANRGRGSKRGGPAGGGVKRKNYGRKSR